MTKFYEVRRRDGAARIGFLSLNSEKKQTPLLFHVESLSSSNEGFEVIHAEDANFNDLFKEDREDEHPSNLFFLFQVPIHNLF
ncbi:MAG TPA: hypothetical protein HA348_06305 [Thermoplasmata archaeon]|nr:hypothetical protein [Thermoplasmata archaeon]